MPKTKDIHFTIMYYINDGASNRKTFWEPSSGCKVTDSKITIFLEIKFSQREAG